MMFPPDMPRKEVERIGLQAGKDLIGGELVYSEHPYTTGYFEGVEVDMVPCYRLTSTEHLQTAVDRTPFHTEYINSHLTAEQKDQVRLLKKFMKGIKAYGAEQDSRGFSGYMCEVLIAKYGSFKKVLEAATAWKDGETIAVEELGPHFDSALVVYDPVDKNRNAASSIHEDTLDLFRQAATAYLEDPSERFFFPNPREPLAPEELEWICAKKRVKLASVYFDRPEGVVDDNLQGQLWRTQYALGKKFKEFDFKVLNAVHSLGKYDMCVIFELENDILSETYKHRGPPTRVRNASEDFCEFWKDNPYGKPYEEGGYWYVEAPRHIRTATEFLEKETAIAGIGRNIDPSTVTIRDHVQTLATADTGLLTALLDPRYPWENRG
jgi:tRNA nucleotidyltransferase (CCA-adding enzyme)